MQLDSNEETRSQDTVTFTPFSADDVNEQQQNNTSTLSTDSPTKNIATAKELEEIQSANKYESVKQSVASGVILGLICFFICISTSLGTGILALPVKAGDSGFEPFLLVIMICTVAQVFTLLYTTDLLQRTQALMRRDKAKQILTTKKNQDSLRVSLTTADDEEGNNENAEAVVMLNESKVKQNAEIGASSRDDPMGFSQEPKPDLHTMARLLLHPIFRIVFEISIIINLVGVLISYSIAGPTALAQLIGYKSYFIYLIAPVALFLTLVVILGAGVIEYILSFLTFGKGLLLLFMVGFAGFVGTAVNNQPVDNWQYVGRPFVLSTVAIGGSVNILPVLYSKMIPSKRNLKIFLGSCILAMVVGSTIVTSWVYFVLKTVPQTSTTPDYPSLKTSQKNGEISTVPFIEVIQLRYPQYAKASLIADIFVFISISVSFISVGSSLKHYLDGIVKTYVLYSSNPNTLLAKLNSKLKFLKRPELLFQITLYTFFFLLSYIIAQCNPQQLFVVLESVAGLTLNIQGGIFIAVMMLLARLPRNRVAVPLAIPNWIAYTAFGMIIYFVLVIGLDTSYTIARRIVADPPF